MDKKELTAAGKMMAPVLKKAGWMALREFYRFDRRDIKLKKHREVVTKVDVESERMIIAAIKRNFPGHGILSEESGRDRGRSDFLWIIDPIDGTTNFTMHNPIWCISLGLAYQNKIVAGAIYSPVTDEMFTAEIGKGAKLNNRKIRVSGVRSGKILNAFCSARDIKHTRQAVDYYQFLRLHGGDCYMLGSAALELAYVAAGRLDSILIPGAHTWDVAAGVILVREAGGLATDFQGADWNPDSESMLASNGLVHRGILNIVGRLKRKKIRQKSA